MNKPEKIEVDIFVINGSKMYSVHAKCKETDGVFLKGISYKFYDVANQNDIVEVVYNKEFFAKVELLCETKIIEKYYETRRLK